MQSIIISKGTKSLVDNKIAELTAVDRGIDNFKVNINDPDFLIVDIKEDKKQISIAQVREVINLLNVQPLKATVKTVVFFNAESLNSEAQNALLKTLEESPEYIRIILVANHHKNLLDTIISRCILIELENESVDYQNELNITRFLDLNIGAKLDIIINLKESISDRGSAVEIINGCILNLHKHLLSETNLDNIKIKRILNSIKMLSNLKQKILHSNVNSTLAFEYFAVNV